MKESPKKGFLPYQSDDSQDWIFSYADMVSLLLCFFIMLFALSKDGNDSSMEETLEEISRGFTEKEENELEDPETLTQTERESRALRLLLNLLNMQDTVEVIVESIEQQFTSSRSARAMVEEMEQSNILRALEEGIGTFRDATRQGQNFVEFVIPYDILFASGSKTISADAMQWLTELASFLLPHLNTMEIEVQGHSDSARAKQAGQNYSVSSARASVVAQRLVDLGIPGSRVRAVGFSQFRPKMNEQVQDRKARSLAAKNNRRVHIVVFKNGS